MGKVARSPEYTDWLESIGAQGGEFKWIMKNRVFPLNTSVKPRPHRRNGTEVKRDVLNSPRVQEAIREESFRRRQSFAKVQEEAREILEIMGNDVDMKVVRMVGYMCTKVIKSIFDGIYVNFGQLEKIRELCKSDSVVFIPSHKSYMDFILVSLLCYEESVTLPAIVAGNDFMNSKFMAEALRKCGAFFIRRSFGSDRLYWAIFSEYVQTHIVQSDRPVEFFVEGTRSRVGKSLFPKYGLMQVLLEPYLRGQVYDMLFVPVSISYDKILEELLHGYELLGFPKPKESTSGLFKARQILDQSFGNCFVTFSEPISIRQHFGKSLHRARFVCQPDSQFILSEKDKQEIRKLGHLIVCRHNMDSVVGVWPLACLAILNAQDTQEESVKISDVLADVKYQLTILERLGSKIQIRHSVEEDLRYYVELHDDLFVLIDHKSEDFELRLRDQRVDKLGSVDRHIMEKAVGRIVLNNYSNKMMHEIVNESIISMILSTMTDHSQNVIFAKYSFLQRLLCREFICMPGEELESFSEAMRRLIKAKIIETFDNKIRVVDEDATKWLHNTLAPFLATYHIVINTIINLDEQHVMESQVYTMVQKNVVNHHSSRTPFVRLSFLSMDPYKNTFFTLASLGIVKKKGKNYEVDYGLLNELQREISMFTKVPTERLPAKL